MKQERTESAHVESNSKDKGKRKRTEEPKNEAPKGPTQKKQNQGDIGTGSQVIKLLPFLGL